MVEILGKSNFVCANFCITCILLQSSLTSYFFLYTLCLLFIYFKLLSNIKLNPSFFSLYSLNQICAIASLCYLFFSLVFNLNLSMFALSWQFFYIFSSIFSISTLIILNHNINKSLFCVYTYIAVEYKIITFYMH